MVFSGTAHRLSFLAHCRFLIGRAIEPYLGVRATASMTRIDNDKVNSERPTRDLDQAGFGLGAAAIIGIDVPPGDRFALYGEGSVGADALWVDDGTNDVVGNSRNTSDGIGGISGVVGTRLRF